MRPILAAQTESRITPCRRRRRRQGSIEVKFKNATTRLGDDDDDHDVDGDVRVCFMREGALGELCHACWAVVGVVVVGTNSVITPWVRNREERNGKRAGEREEVDLFPFVSARHMGRV